MPVTLSRTLLLCTALLGSGAALLSCGGEGGAQPRAPTGASTLDLDGDSVALLPPGAVAAATFDTRTLYDNHAFGAQLAQIAEGLLPLGAETGLVPSRDIDRVTVAWYAVTGADFVAVVRGRIDPAAIQHAADAHSAAHGGGILSATPYSGHTMFTLADVGFSVLTPHTVLAGTAAGLRLALDRIRDGRVRKELSPVMVETLATPQAAFAFAGDFAASPLAGAGELPLPTWVTAVKQVRATGLFREARLNVSGTATFGDPQSASTAAEGTRRLGVLVNTLALTGAVPELQNLDITPEGPQIRFAFAVDEAKLRLLLQQVPQLLPQPAPASRGPNAH